MIKKILGILFPWENTVCGQCHGQKKVNESDCNEVHYVTCPTCKGTAVADQGGTTRGTLLRRIADRFPIADPPTSVYSVPGLGSSKAVNRVYRRSLANRSTSTSRDHIGHE